MSKADEIFSKLFPSAEELWEMGDARMVESVDDNGRSTLRPFFDLGEPEILSSEYKPFVTKKSRRDLGIVASHVVEVDGIDYATRAFVPHDKLLGNAALTITSGTAWTTTIDGYPEDRSIKLFADNVQPVLQVGPPHSGSRSLSPKELLRVPETLREARTASLAHAAQVEQSIFAMLSERYGLPMRQLPIGDSRDSNTTPGQYAYADYYGATIVGFDTKARCAPDRITLADVPEFLSWLSSTAIGGVAVGACLLKDGQLGSLAGTTSFNPNFLASNMTGTMRALASGETGQMISWVPRAAHGTDVLYGRDSLSRVEQIRELWNEHPNVHVKVVPRGTHAALLHPLAHKGRRERIRSFVEEYCRTSGDLDAMNWRRIHGIKEDPQLSAANAA